MHPEHCAECRARKWQIHLGYLKTHLINKSKGKWLITHVALASFYTHLHFTVTRTHTSAPTHPISLLIVADHKAKQTVCIIRGSSEHTWLMQRGSSLRSCQSVSHTASQRNLQRHRVKYWWNIVTIAAKYDAQKSYLWTQYLTTRMFSSNRVRRVNSL